MGDLSWRLRALWLAVSLWQWWPGNVWRWMRQDKCAIGCPVCDTRRSEWGARCVWGAIDWATARYLGRIPFEPTDGNDPWVPR